MVPAMTDSGFALGQCWQGHPAYIQGLRTKLDGLMKNMGAQVSGADLNVNERGATFAMAPNIELAGRWQEPLVQHAVRQAAIERTAA